MKYSFFRILRDWTFWVVLLLSMLFVIGFTVFYVKTCQPESHEWYYNVSSYSSVADLDSQIKNTKDRLTEVGAAIPSSSISDREQLVGEQQWLIASVDILNFLKENINTYKFSDLIDSQYIVDNAKNSVSYYNKCILALFFFQIIAMVFITGQIVNQEKSTGSFILPLMMRGRKKVFTRQLVSSFVVFMITYLIQIALVGTISTLFSSGEKNILYYSKSGITVLSETQDFLLLSLHILIILLSFWALVFFVSQIIDNVLAFSVTSLVTSAGIMLLIYSTESGLLSKFNYPINDILTDVFSGDELTVILSIKAVLSAMLIIAAYIVAKRKNYRIRYE